MTNMSSIITTMKHKKMRIINILFLILIIMNSILERLIKLNQPVSKFVEDKTHPWVLKLLFGIGN